MRSLRPLLLTLSATTALVACALLSRRSLALDPPATSASAVSPAPASASGSAPEASSASAPSKFKFFEGEPVPEGKSPTPKDAEWADGKVIPLRRLPSECEARRVREWVRVRCTSQGSRVDLNAGPSEGLKIQIFPMGPNSAESPYNVVFPLRPGERRMIEMVSMFPNAYGDSWGPGQPFYVSSQWWEGEAPVLTVQ